LPTHQDVVSLLDIQEPIVHCLSEDTFETLRGYFVRHRGHMLWVMPASQVNCEDPRAAMSLGLARTARNELPIKLITIEIDSATLSSVTAETITKILLRVTSLCDESTSVDPDYEYAIVKGATLIPRMHWQTISEVATRHRPQEDAELSTSKCIQIGTPGLLRSMTWREDRIHDLAEGDVLIKTKAIGLNFRVSVLRLFL
jgi:hypothetical protein